MIDYPRPELRRTVLFGETPELDHNPIISKKGRLLAGPEFSARELGTLKSIVKDQYGALELFITPTAKQLARIALNEMTGCWELPTYDDPHRARYGIMSVRDFYNPSNLAHRTMYMVFYGADALPGGRDDHLDHLCENKPCCFPRHLEIVSSAENTRRGRMSHAAGQLALGFEE